MTLQEIESSFQVHQERFVRIDERLDRMAASSETHFARIDETLAYVASQVKEHDRKLQRIEDNLIVQAEILNRVDQRLDRVSAMVESHDQQLGLMQSAMTSLFQRMDAFIQGLERGNGHSPA